MGEKVASIPLAPAAQPAEAAEINFDEIINKSVTLRYCPSLNHLISKAEVVKLNICDLERYLNCLVNADLLSENEQNKYLFVYSCKIGLEAWGRSISMALKVVTLNSFLSFLERK